jgi:hypothetical protein
MRDIASQIRTLTAADAEPFRKLRLEEVPVAKLSCLYRVKVRYGVLSLPL